MVEREIEEMSGGMSGGRLFLHKRFESAAELEAQPSVPMHGAHGDDGFTLYKCFSETPTYAEIEGGKFLYADGIGISGRGSYQSIPLDVVVDMGVAWVLWTLTNEPLLCVSLRMVQKNWVLKQGYIS